MDNLPIGAEHIPDVDAFERLNRATAIAEMEMLDRIHALEKENERLLSDNEGLRAWKAEFLLLGLRIKNACQHD